MAAMRTPDEIFAHHGAALGAEDLDDIVSDYADDAIIISQDQVYRGKDGARAVFTQLLNDIPEAEWQLDTLFADDVLYLEWKANSSGSHVEDGIDTFVFDDGQIRVQTIRYTVHAA
jgi:ketosteroid isomerase-like protein